MHDQILAMLSSLANVWCRVMHEDPMWPIHGKYQCRRCLRYHDLGWDGEAEAFSRQARGSDSVRLNTEGGLVC